MSKHIKKFETQAAYEAFKASENYVTPNLSWCLEENNIKSEAWEPTPQHDYSNDYLTIVSTSNNNLIKWNADNINYAKTISVSTDDGQTWTSKRSSTGGNTLAILDVGDKLLIKGNNTGYGNSSKYNFFTSTGTVDIEGNIMSMVYGDDFIGQTTLSSDYTFSRLFNSTNIVNARNLVLPATTLSNHCYNGMFYGCTNLTIVPELPATTLADSCYWYMFYMCTSLTTPPILPATTLADGCYGGMFQGCTSLITAPTLPVTALADYCYTHMFQGCTSLITAPTLPATTLTDQCYNYMFCDCTSLTTAPLLPATTLVSYCYESMFRGCTHLNYIKCLATDISASNCTTNWTNGVAASGTFVKDPSMSGWTTDQNGIPSGWTVQNAS